MDIRLYTVIIFRVQRVDDYLKIVFEWKSEGKGFTKKELKRLGTDNQKIC